MLEKNMCKYSLEMKDMETNTQTNNSVDSSIQITLDDIDENHRFMVSNKFAL